MDILIKNMNNKPKNCILEEHLSDGTVVKHEVVELPPHGELIERSKVYNILDQRIAFYKEIGDMGEASNLVNIEAEVVNIPTVLEASTEILN